MNARRIWRALQAPVDSDRIAATARRLSRCDGSAPLFGFAFVYFSAATSVVASGVATASASLLADAAACAARWLEPLAAASLRALPIFALAWACDLARAAWPQRRALHAAPLALLYALLAVQLLAASIDLVSFLYFHERISAGVLFVLAETNFAESREFVGAYANAKLLLLAAFLLAPLLVLAQCRSETRGHRVRRALAGAYLALAAVGALRGEPGAAAAYDPGIALFRGVVAYRDELRSYRELEASLAAVDLRGEVESRSKAGRNVHLLVIGESTSRAHMSLYGYERRTSPRLEAMRADLHVFDDVISPSSHTASALKLMLTAADNDDAESWAERTHLLDVYRAAGFRTYWISNQEAYGVWGNAVSVLASRADIRIFLNRESSRSLSARLDAEILPHLERILAERDAGDQFIVLHLMGAHSRYHERYPAEFAAFSGAAVEAGDRAFLDDARREIINHYDNAVLYNDWIVSAIIDRARAVDAKAFVLYLSDHGEEVYDQRDYFGHNVRVANRFMVEIPMLLWLSPEFTSSDPDAAAAIAANLDQPFMTDHLDHTLLDLSGLSYAALDRTRSLAHRGFDPSRKRVFAQLDYDQHWKRDRSRYLIRENFEKIWAHRVNSVGKLKQAEAIFSGIELDVVYHAEQGGYFDVNHPPAKSIGLRLDDYLASADATSSRRYWLDIKNLSDDNKQGVLDQLRRIIARHDLRADRIIAESPNFEALRHLARGGLVTSYYLPTVELGELSESERERWADQLVASAQRSEAWAISCPGTMLPFARSKLMPRLPGMKLLTWFPKLRIDDWRHANFLQTIVDADDVEVVLVGYHTPHDR